jgi:peptidyl-prolyl cis-trans isomerase C
MYPRPSLISMPCSDLRSRARGRLSIGSRSRERAWTCLRTLSGLSLLAGLALSSGACSDKAPANQAADSSEAAKVETKHGLTREQAKQPLVVIGETTVTVGDFAEQLADKSPYLRARYASPERRRELLDELVKFELLAKEATRRGLDQSEEVVRTKKQLMVQQMMKAEFEDKVKLSDITDDEIKAYYDAHPDEFNKPAQVRASVVLVKDEAKAKKLQKQVLDKPDDNELFRELAKRESDDPVLAERYGDLQFFSRPSDRKPGDAPVPDAIAEAAFKLDKIGDLAPELVKTESGYAIVKLTGKRKELARTLEQTRRTIQHKLWRERREAAIDAFVKTLRAKANVQENWQLLEQVKVEPAVLSGSDAGLARTPERARGAARERTDAAGKLERTRPPSARTSESTP